MPDIVAQFTQDMADSSSWVPIWVNFMGAVLSASILVGMVRREALAITLAFIPSAIAVLWLYSIFGYERILGLGHIVFWTPALVWLWSRRAHWQVRETLAGKYLVLAVAVMVISLVFDVTDAARWLLGDK